MSGSESTPATVAISTGRRGRGRAAGHYPGWSGQRLPIAEATAVARVDPAGARVAGRFYRGASRDLLEDGSQVIEVVAMGSRPPHGAIISGRLFSVDSQIELREVATLAPARRELGAELRGLAARRACFTARAAIIAAIRSHFTAQGFLEVETPSRVVNPGLEPHLRPFPAGHGSDGVERYLITSPELHLKRLLAAGYERIFELARAFRDDELGSHHVSEFLLLEWYRAYATLADLAADLTALVIRCAHAAGVDPTRGVPSCDLTAPCVELTYGELFRRHVGHDPSSRSVDQREIEWVNAVEPHLGLDAPLLVTEFPPDVAALARLVPPSDGTGYDQVAARMELYIAGIELANGFDELNDPIEQRRRHEFDRATRRSSGLSVPSVDEGFLAALEAGMPPAAGMALGVDRLVMVILGAADLRQVRTFA